jgi:hypothetical protein
LGSMVGVGRAVLTDDDRMGDPKAERFALIRISVIKIMLGQSRAAETKRLRLLLVHHRSQISDKLVTGRSPLFPANRVQYSQVACDHDSSIRDLRIQDLQGESV